MQIKNGIYRVGVQNPTLRVFDIVMRTEYGTTYNAYAIDDEQPTLVETVHERFTDEYIAKISKIAPPERFRYIIFNHTEPDHSGSLLKLLELCPDITVVGSAAALRNLTGITGREFRSLAVKDGDTLNIGRRTLQFVSAPNLHWPDSMFTYSEADKAVFTCDFLGAHYCEEAMVDTALKYPEKYDGAFQHYYDCIFAPFKKFVLAGLDKLAALEFDTVLNSHGPVLTETYAKAAELYRRWSTPEPKAKKTAAVPYVSAYGYTRKLAETAVTVLREAGYEVRAFDLTEAPADPAFVAEADWVLLGTPTINRDALKPVWDLVASLDAVETAGKKAAVFGSYGWSGEGVPALAERLKSKKWNVRSEFRVRFRPGDDDLKAWAEEVRRLASE